MKTNRGTRYYAAPDGNTYRQLSGSTKLEIWDVELAAWQFPSQPPDESGLEQIRAYLERIEAATERHHRKP